MVFVYLISALTILFNSSFLEWLPSQNRIILGTIILAYTAFKIYRIFRDKKRSEIADESV